MELKVINFILLVIVSVSNGARKYNTNTFYINPKSTRLIQVEPSSRCLVLNVGKPTLKVEILQGNVFKWTKPIATRVFMHGFKHTFAFDWYHTSYAGVRVINNENINGFIHIHALGRGYDEFDEQEVNFFEIDKDKLLRTVVTTGISKIPVVGEGLSIIVDFFWPEKEENVWEQIEDQVKELLDSRIQETVDGILGGAIKQFKTRMKTVLHEVSNPNYTQTVGTHYVNIAEDLVGLEHRFEFKGENAINTNYFLLPLYATSVNLKLALYQYGIKNWKTLRIDKELVGRLTYYISELIHNSASGAIAHIKKTCKDKLDKEYKDAYAETIYDQLASVHAFCALNGFEHLPLWKVIAADPKITPKKPDVPVLVYSTQFGRNTAEQSTEMVSPSYPSLTPKIRDGKYSVPIEVAVYQTPDDLIAGLEVTASNKRSYNTGRVARSKTYILFEGKRLTKLVARGTGQINALIFTFEDGRVERIGKEYGDTREFSIMNHHIIGFYMTDSIMYVKEGQAANIAVSYTVMMD